MSNKDKKRQSEVQNIPGSICGFFVVPSSEASAALNTTGPLEMVPGASFESGSSKLAYKESPVRGVVLEGLGMAMKGKTMWRVKEMLESTALSARLLSGVESNCFWELLAAPTSAIRREDQTATRHQTKRFSWCRTVSFPSELSI